MWRSERRKGRKTDREREEKTRRERERESEPDRQRATSIGTTTHGCGILDWKLPARELN